MTKMLRLKSLADLPARHRPGNKFGARKKQVSGVMFDSTREATRYSELALRQKSGEISNLRTQVSFDLCVNGIFVCRYVADFTWTESGATVTADAKGFKTREYSIKKKLMHAVHGVEIVEL